MDSETLEKLKALYLTDRGIRGLIDALSKRKNNPKNLVTTVEELIDSNPELEGRDAYNALKMMERLEFGKFMIGRRGHKTRLEWSVAPLDIANQVVGNKEISDVETDRSDQTCLDYPFVLRHPELTLTFRLPKDLSANEAERIANFIKSLPV